MIEQLKSVKEVDGSRLFDNVTVTLGTNIRSIHYLKDCPTIVTGGGAGFKMGHNMVLPDETPLNNVWLTMLKGTGVQVDSHGDSTGVIEELRA